MLTGATGNTLDTPPEPILGRIQRFLAVATEHYPRAEFQRPQRTYRTSVLSSYQHTGGQPATGGPECRALPMRGLTSWMRAWSLPTGHNASQRRSFDPPREGPFGLAWGRGCPGMGGLGC